MPDGHGPFQFIEEVQNCPGLWDVSSAAYRHKKQAEENGRTSEEIGCNKVLCEQGLHLGAGARFS